MSAQKRAAEVYRCCELLEANYEALADSGLNPDGLRYRRLAEQLQVQEQVLQRVIDAEVEACLVESGVFS